jgi:hypothetical protein
MNDLKRPWDKWEEQDWHVKNNISIGGLQAFTSPLIFLLMADAVLRYKPDVICDVHSYKMGMTAFLAATSHHLGIPVWSINSDHYQDEPHKNLIKEMGLSKYVKHVAWNPFNESPIPTESPKGRILLFLNVNTYSAIDRSLVWLLGAADEALIVFHATEMDGTKRYVSDFSVKNIVSPWVPTGPRRGHWCENGLLLWKKGIDQKIDSIGQNTERPRVTIVEMGLGLYANGEQRTITDYVDVVKAVYEQSASDYVLYFTQSRISPIQNMVKDESIILKDTTWKAVSDHTGSNFLISVGMLRILQQRGASVSIIIPLGAEIGQAKMDVAKRFGVPVEYEGQLGK